MKLPPAVLTRPRHLDLKRVARTEREAAGLSLREMAKRMKMSFSYLSLMELGEFQWSQKHVDAFNQALKGDR